jgi:isocitrate dehydrogenase
MGRMKIETLFKKWSGLTNTKHIKEEQYSYEEMIQFAQVVSDRRLDEFKHKLIERTHSMEEFANEHFNGDFASGNNTALRTIRRQIKELSDGE